MKERCGWKSILLAGGTTAKDMKRYKSPCVKCPGIGRRCDNWIPTIGRLIRERRRKK